MLFDVDYDYGRVGLALLALGVGFHLARGRSTRLRWRATTPRAALPLLVAAAPFLGWMFTPVVDDELLRAEVGYLGAAAVLCGLLAAVYRRVG